MKIKTLSKNLLIVLTMLTMVMSVFMLSACGKKDPHEKPFDVKTLTAEQAQTVLNVSIENAKQSTNVSVESNGDSMKYLATAEGCYEEEDGVEFDWYLYENNSWVNYSARFMDDEYKYPSKMTTEANADTGIELLFDDCLWFIVELEITGGTQTAENVYILTGELDMEGESESILINCEVVDGYIVSLVATVTEVNGETITGTYDFEYNVEDLEIPQLPNLEWQ